MKTAGGSSKKDTYYIGSSPITTIELFLLVYEIVVIHLVYLKEAMVDELIIRIAYL